MAVRKLNPERELSPEHLQMKDQIVAEMRRAEREPCPPDGPVVLVEENRYARTKHYYVVWDRLAGLDQETRGLIVLEAIQEFDAKEALNTTIAMGFTKDEAAAVELAFEAE